MWTGSLSREVSRCAGWEVIAGRAGGGVVQGDKSWVSDGWKNTWQGKRQNMKYGEAEVEKNMTVIDAFYNQLKNYSSIGLLSTHQLYSHSFDF